MSEDPLTAWTGRTDGDGPEHVRWHQRVQPAPHAHEDAGPHVGLLGFRSDEGVRRNAGRVGAADGPDALRRALGPLALHGEAATGGLRLLDHGDAATVGEDLETGQRQAAQLVTTALDVPSNALTVVLGGGHETAWASYRGLLESAPLRQAPMPRWGVLNLDAHFDLREADRATSGTPFAQMAAAEASAGRDLDYAVVGIAEPANTGVLFDRARQLGVRWMTDLECEEAGGAGVRGFVEDFARDLDVLYLTIDLDVLPSAIAPGVSSPAGYGISPGLVLAAVRAAAASGKLVLLDVVELSPPLDAAGRTARMASRLIDEAVRTAGAAPSGPARQR